MDNLSIEYVIGISIHSPFSLQNLDKETILYAAGATLVFFNTVTQKQTFHLTAPISPKSISSISISADKRYILLGEIGHQPRILIYDLKNSSWQTPLIGHKTGIMTAQISPDMNYVVSIGSQTDGLICIWDWKNGQRLFSTKYSSPIFSLAFHPNSKYFVTGGAKHIKLWDLSNAILDYSSHSRNAVFAEHKNATVMDLSFYGKFMYAITLDGYLLMLNEDGVLEKWLNTKMSRGTCVLATADFVACGGSEGKVRFFSPEFLCHISNAPKTVSLQPQQAINEIPLFPEAVSMTLFGLALAIVFSNRSITLFNLNNIAKPSITCTIVQHSDCVWGCDSFIVKNETVNDIINEAHGFVTYSSDGSVIFWDSDLLQREDYHQSPRYFTTLVADPNGMAKFLHLDRYQPTNDFVTGRTGIRSLAIDPSKKLIACGDRSGSIGVFLFETFERVAKIQAHEQEVVKLSFAIVGNNQLVLASSTRDRLIFIYDATLIDGVYPFDLLQTLSEHTSTLTSMIFADSGSKLISSGSDKAIIFRSLVDEENLNFEVFCNTSCKSSVYNMTLAEVGRQVITSSQDRRITLYELDSGNFVKSFSTSLQSLDATSKANPFLSTLATDPTGAIVCAGASDRSLHLIDTQTEKSLFRGIGHGDLVTSVSFINHGSHIASTGADGCVFIWRVPEGITKKMGYIQQMSNLGNFSNAESPSAFFKFDEKDLPGWARIGQPHTEERNSSVGIPTVLGKWANRVEGAVVLPETSVDEPNPQILSAKLEPTNTEVKTSAFSDIETDSDVDAGCKPDLVSHMAISSGNSSPIVIGTSTTGSSPTKYLNANLRLLEKVVFTETSKDLDTGINAETFVSKADISNFKSLAIRISESAIKNGSSDCVKAIEEVRSILSTSTTEILLDKYSSELVELVKKKLERNLL